jgi:myo-inositol 2-dehydrogenase/D-chiro-inositol 1-dehydrogenase
MNVGVIGAGGVGFVHCRTLALSCLRANLAGVADTTRGRAVEASCLGPHVPVFDDPIGMIHHPAVDAIIVASPDVTHERYVLACIEAGKPVLCEKPLASSVSGCERIVEREVSLGKRLISVGYMRRHDPSYIQLKNSVSSGHVGMPLLVASVHRNRALPTYINDRSLLLNSAVHDIDVMRWLLDDEIRTVKAHSPRAESPSTSPIIIYMESASGVGGLVEVWLGADYGYETRCEVVGSGGTVMTTTPWPIESRINGTVQRRVPAGWLERFAQAYQHEVDEWAEAISTGRTPRLASAWDGYKATQVASAAQETLFLSEGAILECGSTPGLYVV